MASFAIALKIAQMFCFVNWLTGILFRSILAPIESFGLVGLLEIILGRVFQRRHWDG